MQRVFFDQQGQAAVESILSVLIILLLMLGSGQLLYVSLVSNEAVQRVHKETLEHFQQMNTNGDARGAGAMAKEIIATVEADPGKAYGMVVNNWSLFHRDYPPESQPASRYSGGGKKYVAKRGLFIAAGPLKSKDDKVDAKGDGYSAFGIPRGRLSDGDGWNTYGAAIRNDEFDKLCHDLGITNTYFR